MSAIYILADPTATGGGSGLTHIPSSKVSKARCDQKPEVEIPIGGTGMNYTRIGGQFSSTGGPCCSASDGNPLQPSTYELRSFE